MLEKILVKAPHRKGQNGTTAPAAPDLVDVKAVRGGVIERHDGGHVALVEVESEMFNLLGADEQDRRIVAFAQVLNSLPWPVQIVLTTEPLDMDAYVTDMERVGAVDPDGVGGVFGPAFADLARDLARDVLAEATVFAVAGKSREEALTRARRVQSALTGAGFKNTPCDQTRVGELLLLTYGHGPGLDIANALSGAQTLLRGTHPDATTLSDILTPESVQEVPGRLDLGGVHARTFMAVAYPGSVGPGWLDGTLHFRHGRVRSRVALHVRRIAQNKALSELNRQQTNLDLSLRWAARQGRRADIYAEEARIDAEELRQDLARGFQQMFDVTLLVTLMADSAVELDEASAELKQAMEGRGLALRDCYLEEAPAFRSTAPLGLCLVERVRPLPTLCVATAYPFTAGELLHPKGHLWGVNRLTGNAVVVDPRRMVQPHVLVVAATRSGKSYLFKVLATQSLLLGFEDIIIIDPSPAIDYKRWAEAMGGVYVRFAVNSLVRLNPCEILLPADRRLMEDDEFRNPVTAKVAFLKAVIEAMTYPDRDHDPMSGLLRARLEAPLYRVYERFGMTDDWASIVDTDPERASARLVAKRSPTLSDVLEEIEAESALSEVAERLRPYVKGTLSMFSGETNVDLGGRLVILNVDALRQAGGQELQTVAYMMIGEHIRQRLMATRRRKLVGIDEAHILFARRDTAEFVSGLSRTAAKVGGRTMLITQSITDLIGDPKTGIRAAGEQPARVYLGQVGTTVLLRNDKRDDVELIAGLFGLSDSEAEGILSAERGEGLLIAGDERVQVLVMAPDVLHPIIVTDFVPDEAMEEE